MATVTGRTFLTTGSELLGFRWGVVIDILNAGRDRVAKAKLERDAIEARIMAARPIAINPDIA